MQLRGILFVSRVRRQARLLLLFDPLMKCVSCLPLSHGSHREKQTTEAQDERDKRNHEAEEGGSDRAAKMVEDRLLRHKHFRNFFTGSGPALIYIYLGGVQPALFAPLTQVVPLGP